MKRLLSLNAIPCDGEAPRFEFTESSGKKSLRKLVSAYVSSAKRHRISEISLKCMEKTAKLIGNGCCSCTCSSCEQEMDATHAIIMRIEVGKN